MPATFEQIEEIDASFVETAGADLVASFLSAKIIGKRYLSAGDSLLPLIEAVPKFLLVYPMAIWVSRALASGRRDDAVQERDLRGALRLLDRSLGQMAVASLPRKQAKVCDFVMLDTDFVVCARNSLLGVGEEEA